MAEVEDETLVLRVALCCWSCCCCCCCSCCKAFRSCSLYCALQRQTGVRPPVASPPPPPSSPALGFLVDEAVVVTWLRPGATGVIWTITQQQCSRRVFLASLLWLPEPGTSSLVAALAGLYALPLHGFSCSCCCCSGCDGFCWL